MRKRSVYGRPCVTWAQKEAIIAEARSTGWGLLHVEGLTVCLYPLRTEKGVRWCASLWVRWDELRIDHSQPRRVAWHALRDVMDWTRE